MIERIEKNKKLIAMILVALLVFCRCNLGIIRFPFSYINIALNILAILFLVVLTIKDKENTKKAIFSIAALWIVVFAIMEYAYVFFNIGTPLLDLYSRQYTVLTMGPAILIFGILWHMRRDILDILCVVGTVLIPTTFILTLFYDPLWKTWFTGGQYRFGETPGGTLIDTGNLYMLMLIPILYRIVVEKQYKKYLWVTIVGLLGVIFSGSKSSLMPIVIVVGIFVIFGAETRKIMRRNILIFIAILVVAAILFFTVPLLYGLVTDRFIELIEGMNSTEFDYNTSTGQRMAIVHAFKEHFWEHPFFGHGFYAFKTYPFSAVTKVEIGVNELGQKIYELQNSQTHMNFMELLFSFGFFGFVVYYWFPVSLIIRCIKSADKVAKMITSAYLVSFFFMDLGIDMFYKYMTPFFVYMTVYCLLKRSE